MSDSDRGVGGAAATGGPPVAWWTEAEVRRALGRRATLVVLDAGGAGGDGAGSASARCVYALTEGGQLSARVAPIEPDRRGRALPGLTLLPTGDADSAALRITDADPDTLSYLLEVHAGDECRRLELTLRRDDPDQPTVPDVVGALVLLHSLLWG